MYLVIEEDDSGQIKTIITAKSDISDAWQTIKRLRKHYGGFWDRCTVISVELDEDDENVMARRR
jgi:hypothetical protein